MKIKAFTSDQHFGHESIIALSARPFYSINHMTEVLIERYNRVIEKTDTVVWVGDAFFLKKELIAGVMEGLNGHKIIVRGNHDKGTPATYLSYGFDLVVDTFLMLEIEGINVKICHYPYQQAQTDWFDKHKDKRPIQEENEILIHGHTHQKQKRVGNMIHVGVDAWNYTPVLFDDVVKMVKEIKEEKLKLNTDNTM